MDSTDNAGTSRRRRGSFRELMERAELAELDQMSAEDKLKLIRDARAYRQFVQGLGEYNALRQAARDADVSTRLVRRPSLRQGEDDDALDEFALWQHADGMDDRRLAESIERGYQPKPDAA